MPLYQRSNVKSVQFSRRKKEPKQPENVQCSLKILLTLWILFKHLMDTFILVLYPWWLHTALFTNDHVVCWPVCQVLSAQYVRIKRPPISCPLSWSRLSRWGYWPSPPAYYAVTLCCVLRNYGIMYARNANCVRPSSTRYMRNARVRVNKKES